MANRRCDLATGPARRSKIDLDRSKRRADPTFRDLLGLVMTATTEPGDPGRDFLSAVALLRDLPQHKLVRGQVGTVVETLDESTALVEFSADDGGAYAIIPCPRDALLVLRTAPLAA
jgi:Domain of unknown function (DUF4926)